MSVKTSREILIELLQDPQHAKSSISDLEKIADDKHKQEIESAEKRAEFVEQTLSEIRKHMKSLTSSEYAPILTEFAIAKNTNASKTFAYFGQESGIAEFNAIGRKGPRKQYAFFLQHVHAHKALYLTSTHVLKESIFAEEHKRMSRKRIAQDPQILSKRAYVKWQKQNAGSTAIKFVAWATHDEFAEAEVARKAWLETQST